MTFKQDRLENEKNDPKEASSLTFINVPIILLALFIGFGATYLALRTPNTSLTPGDSRTLVPTEKSDDAAKQEPSVNGAAVDIEALIQKGQQVFTTTCQACHQADGGGIPGAFPPLAGSEWVNGPGKQVIAIILHGIQGEITVKGQKFQSVMPTFKDQLKPEEIAAVATYIRNSFGNKAEAVTPALVEQVKDETKSRTSPWNGETELKKNF